MIPFKTPTDYFNELLGGVYENINSFPELLAHTDWRGYDNDLHIYPYIHATPAVLSMGCPNQCSFCPTAKTHQGKIHFGDYQILIPKYKDKIVHFMDENFFYNDMKKVLPRLKQNNVIWLAMTDSKNWNKILDEFGEDYLFDCGCRIVEIGLENIILYPKVKEHRPTSRIETYYLNMSFLPEETKWTIKENAEWMRDKSLKHPIHFNNGLWYAPGQFYYPYGEVKGGTIIQDAIGRTKPTFLPDSLAVEEFFINDLELTNYYAQLVMNTKYYPEKDSYNVKEFIGNDANKAFWFAVGIRCGGIL